MGPQESGYGMKDPKKERYIYLMLAIFGAISLSIVFFFFMFRLQGIGTALKQLGSILAPFIYGGVFAYLLRPLCNAFETFFAEFLPKKTRRAAGPLAVTLSMLSGIFLVYALIDMVAPQFVRSIVTIWNVLPDKITQLVSWCTQKFGEDERIVQFINNNYENAMTQIEEWVKNTLLPQFSNIVTGVGTTVWSVVQFFYNLLVGLIVAVYLLAGRKRFARQGTLIVRSMFNPKWSSIILEEVKLVDEMFGGFIDGKLLDSLIVGVICYISCLILRIPNALLASVIVGVTNIIPVFGPAIGAVPATLLILIEEPMKALWFLIFCVLILQQLDGNVIGPRILGNSTGLSGFWVMFAIILFGGIWGFAGMIIGVPLFAVIYDLIKKMVKKGLKRNDSPEAWEKYKAEYPDAPPKTAELPKIDISKLGKAMQKTNGSKNKKKKK